MFSFPTPKNANSSPRVKKMKSLKLSIIQIFAFLILITVSSITLNFYHGFDQSVQTLFEQLTVEITQKIIDRTSYFLKGPATQTQLLSQLIKQKHLIEHHQELWQYLWAPLMAFPQMQTLFLADQTGNYVQVRRDTELITRLINAQTEIPTETWIYRDEHYRMLKMETKASTFDPRTRPWFKNTQNKLKVYWTDVYVFTTSQTPGISASYPILNSQGQLTTVVCANIPLENLSEFLSRQKVSEHGIIFIINAKGELIAYPDASLTVTQDMSTGEQRLTHVRELKQPWVREAYQVYQDTQQKRFVLNSEGTNYIVRFVDFPEIFDSQWQIVVIIPKYDLLVFFYKVLVYTLFVALFIFIISVIAVYFFAEQITRPIAQLTRETLKLSSFHLDDVKSIHSQIKEIALMNRAILTASQGLQSFKRYVPSALVRQLVQLGQEAKLGGEERELTILFSDVADFTSIAEQISTEELMLILGSYLENLSTTIMEHSGTIDKYIGDAIMAFWGAPVQQNNSPYLACRAALSCQRKVDEFNEYWLVRGKYPFYTRIGVHTGNTIVGNIGSQYRMNYTIIGDSVNLAARLEGANKWYGTKIIISEATYQLVEAHFICRLLDIVAVKGKTQGIRIYELLGEKEGEGIDEVQQQFCQEYELCFQFYLQQDWECALQRLRLLQLKFPIDKSVQLLIKRCQFFRDHPEHLPSDWDGTTFLDQK